MLIQEFHSKLSLRNDQTPLFNALRRLRWMESLKSAALEEGGWILWTDDATQDPDGGSLFSAALATA